ncbi:MAG TPA: hypothetical protein VMT69_17910 [Kineosporiaceae bacterium]|nr:hypothetical protein [Kineosporiaceae bacterium]
MPEWARYPRTIDERVTRFLCATTHLDGSFANHAWWVLLSPNRQGQAPEQEIDPVAVGRHAILSLRRRTRRDRLLALLLLVVVIAAVLLFFAGLDRQERLGRVVLSVIALPFVGWFVALVIVYQHYAAVRRSAIDIHHQRHGRARRSAPPLAPEVETRLEQLHRANVAIFNAYVPFVGTGHTLDTWKLTLYAPGQGFPAPSRAILPEEVHHYLYHEVPNLLPNVIAERRLYVDGGMAPNVPGLIPRSPGPRTPVRPPAIVDDDLLDEYTLRPTRTARTYVCFVENSGNGDVVVTVLVRAEKVGDTVYVEGRSQVLLPVQPGFKDVYWVSQNADQAFLPVLRAAVPATTALWLESPIRLIKYWLGDRSDERTLKHEGLRIERGQPVNYGAGSSLRQDAMLPADPGYYGAADEVMYFRTMTQQILTCLSTFLEDHKLGTQDFEEQRRLIIEQTFNVDGIRNDAPKGTANLAL